MSQATKAGFGGGLCVDYVSTQPRLLRTFRLAELTIVVY